VPSDRATRTTALQFMKSYRPARSTAACAACLILLLTGCAGFELPMGGARAGTPPAAPPAVAQPPADAEPVTPAAPSGRELTAADRAEIQRLLRMADYALADDQLTHPPAFSALTLYDRVRLIDPDNVDARHGIEMVVERFIALARQAAEQRQFAVADAMLARAMLVDPAHIGVQPALAQTRLLASASRNLYRLDTAALDARSDALLATLRQAGQASRAPGCRAIIRARNDAEGRWIYQQMSAAPGRNRIRAELQVAGSPSIESLCFQGTD